MLNLAASSSSFLAYQTHLTQLIILSSLKHFLLGCHTYLNFFISFWPFLINPALCLQPLGVLFSRAQYLDLLTFLPILNHWVTSSCLIALGTFSMVITFYLCYLCSSFSSVLFNNFYVSCPCLVMFITYLNLYNIINWFPFHYFLTILLMQTFHNLHGINK